MTKPNLARNRADSTSKSHKHTASETPPLPPLRSMERLLAGLVGGGRSKRRAVDEAQELMYDAWEAQTAEERVRLATKALAISPHCADAYLLLAEEMAGTAEELLEFCRLATAAGERALGKKMFKEEAGHFWGILETRPYMRARAGLAGVLWRIGEREEAVEHYWDLLRLNPNDNQGIRDLLMPCLIELNRDADAERLHRQYEEDGMAVWMYSRALLDFRAQGDTANSVASLKAAIEENTHVPAYLLGHRKIPRTLPDYIGFGDVNEAVSYAYGNKQAWRATQGALPWLAAHRK